MFRNVVEKTKSLFRNVVENAELRKRIVEAYHQSKTRDHLRLVTFFITKGTRGKILIDLPLCLINYFLVNRERLRVRRYLQIIRGEKIKKEKRGREGEKESDKGEGNGKGGREKGKNHTKKTRISIKNALKKFRRNLDLILSRTTKRSIILLKSNNFLCN